MNGWTFQPTFTVDLMFICNIDQLPFINMTYQATEHAGTTSTLNLLKSVHELRYPIDVMCGLPHGYESMPCPIT